MSISKSYSATFPKFVFLNQLIKTVLDYDTENYQKVMKYLKTGHYLFLLLNTYLKSQPQKY